MSTPRFEGAVVRIGGNDYTIPPLTLGQLRRLRSQIDGLNMISQKPGELADEQVDAVADIVYAALSRNYPEINRDSVLDMLDLGNMAEVFQAVMGVSGLKKAIAAAAQTGAG